MRNLIFIFIAFFISAGTAAAQLSKDIDLLVEGVNSELSVYNKARAYNFVYNDYSRRDPMRNLLKAPVREPVKKEVSPGRLYLTGIVYNDNIPMAFINDEVCREGDFIGSSQIKKIDKEKVVIVDNGRESELFMEWN